MPNYSYNDSPMTPSVETMSRLPRSVQLNPPLPPRNPNFTPLADMPAPTATPTVAMSPASSPAPVGSGVGSVWKFLASLFGGGGSAAPQLPAQGMRGLLQTPMPRGRGAPGTDALGNPLGRF